MRRPTTPAPSSQLYNTKTPSLSTCTLPQLLTAVVANGERPQFPSHCPAAYSELAQQCMLSDFGQRPSTEAVMSRLTAMRGPVKSGGLEETMGVPRAVARSEALRMMRVMSMGGVSVHPACMGEVCQCTLHAWGRCVRARLYGGGGVRT